MAKSKSDFLLDLIQHWPFSQLPAAKRIENYWRQSSQFHQPLEIPQGDRIDFLASNYSVIIPYEEAERSIEVVDSILRTYRSRGTHTFNNTSRVSSTILSPFPYEGSRYNLGISHIDEHHRVGFSFMNIQLVTLSDSFFMLTFSVIPTEEKKYEFWQLTHSPFSRKMVVHEPSIRKLFREWGFSVGSESEEFRQSYDQFFNDLRCEFALMLRNNGLTGYLGNNLDIPAIHVLGFRKEPDKNRNAVDGLSHFGEDFWNALNVYDNKSMMLGDSKGVFSMPINTIMPPDNSGTQFLYVNEDLVDVPALYWSIENMLITYLDDWSLLFQSNIAVNTFLEQTYLELRSLAARYHTAQERSSMKTKPAMELNREINAKLQWFTQLSHEYSQPRQRRSTGFPDFHLAYDGDDSKILWLDAQSEVATKRISALKELSRFYKESINEYRDYVLTAGNQRIQCLLIVLTVITVVIGIMQILLAC